MNSKVDAKLYTPYIELFQFLISKKAEQEYNATEATATKLENELEEAEHIDPQILRQPMTF